MRELALFAGAGGGILGGKLLGWRTVCAVEINPYARKVLLARQKDGTFDRFPIWDNVESFQGKQWRGGVDIITGGFPCQDISVARTNSRDNGKQEGLDGARSGLWSHYKRIIGEVQPDFVQIENSPNLRTKGLVRILKDLDAMGYNARWGVLGVRQYGADHLRERIWIVASHSDLSQRQGGGLSSGIHAEDSYAIGADWWQSEPGMERVADGIPDRYNRLKAIGNAQIPIVAALAWKILGPVEK